MANVLKVKFNLRGVEEAFRSGGVVDKMHGMADEICESANQKTDEHYPKEGFKKPHFVVKEYKTSYGNTGFYVRGNTPLGNRAQAEHNVLTEAMDAGRG